MRNMFVLCVASLWMATATFAQVGINTDNSTPDNSAMLDVKSISKGLLTPRMTQEQIGSITYPANGLVVFCTTDNKLYVYISAVGQWKEVAYGTGLIIPPFSCGIPITINHMAGSVSPVSKIVTYGTVTNIPGEPSKCWITSNLGADHQATAVSDTTEVSAGWYWQFNRKQGYMHDGTTRTPNTTWITSIIENTDWIAANDPCALQLGNGWRIPTSTEWNNINATGGWTNWNGPWNSALKMHAAGYLDPFDGSLNLRGSKGFYWSSTQIDAWYGRYLVFHSGNSNIYANGYKTYGFSARCVRDN